MAFSLALATRRRRLQSLIDDIDAAATPGHLLLYAGARPTAGGAPTGDLQCDITLAQPCAEMHPTDAIVAFVSGVEGLRVDDETIVWGRFTDGDGTFVADADVSLTGDGGDIQISNVNGVVGAFVRIQSGLIGE